MTTINTSLQELNDDRRREWGLYLVNDDARTISLEHALAYAGRQAS